MPRLIWSEASLRDIVGIDAFLADENPVAAARIVRAIKATALRLVDFPRIGRGLDEPFRVFGVRTTPYLIIYRLRHGEIEIVRVRHASENWFPRSESDP